CRVFSGNIYDPTRSRIFTEDGRGYLERTEKRFDLIQMSLLESMESASAGVYSLNENYLFTTEALRTALGRLTPGGILSISRWIKNPPRDSIKILATAITALGPCNAAGSIVMIRSWQTATLLVKKGNFTPTQIETVRKFCRERLFDLCYYPGIKREETNLVNRLDESYFFTAATRLLAGEGERFYEEYPFYIRPATDDRPFFAHTFKGAIITKYLIPHGRVSIPLIDWGYILVWTALGILVILSLVLIVLPIRIAGRKARGRVPVFVYFGSLGLAYMFLEMSFLQQFIRYLYDPVFSAAVVIGSFLVYSGIGSLIAGEIGTARHKQVLIAVVWIAAVATLYLIADTLLQGVLFALPLGMRMVICSLLIVPLALPMGVPFPAGLSRLEAEGAALIPWAWGINGFLSVIGASAAVLVAIGWGFRSVVLAALALYLLAAAVYRGWFRRGNCSHAAIASTTRAVSGESATVVVTPPCGIRPERP
ncbi:MAG: SAM-dependent methyltransferase, partial [Deltaproteobacteria bacterium]|nr:SAM-dependent methyltransferase [Deltaproteobacteria bacterium]